jgi:hypothetical protein
MAHTAAAGSGPGGAAIKGHLAGVSFVDEKPSKKMVYRSQIFCLGSTLNFKS